MAMTGKILAIYGSGGLGREVYDIANRRNAVSSQWSKIIFINDFTQSDDFRSTSMVAFTSILSSANKIECVIATGEPSVREKLFNKVAEAGITFATLIDPHAQVSPFATLGKGTIVSEYSSIHCDVTIGENCLIQPYSNIGHDISIDDHSVMSSHCAPGGASRFGKRVYVGMHASIKENLTIGDDAIVGMGAVVFRDVVAGSVVVGNPARVTKGSDDGRVFR